MWNHYPHTNETLGAPNIIREALTQRLEYHLSNGVTIWLAFHTGPEAPPAFVASNGRGQDEGTLIGANVSYVLTSLLRFLVYVYTCAIIPTTSLRIYMRDYYIPTTLDYTHLTLSKPTGIYVSTAIDHIAIPRLPSSPSNPEAFPFPLAGICPRRFLSDVKV